MNVALAGVTLRKGQARGTGSGEGWILVGCEIVKNVFRFLKNMIYSGRLLFYIMLSSGLPLARITKTTKNRHYTHQQFNNHLDSQLEIL